MVLVCVALLGVVGVIGKAWYDSRLPGTYSVMDYGTHDYGGGSVRDDHSTHGGGMSVPDLHGPTGSPDARFTLTRTRRRSGSPRAARSTRSRSTVAHPGPSYA